MTSKNALISVYNKSNLKYLCKNLDKHGYKFISTGSTSKKIKSLGYDCKEVSNISKLKEILNGRVKTLNHKIFGSILFKRENKTHKNEFKKLKIPKIDIVVVNFYPFKEFLNYKNEEKVIEMIDIGGPSLLRASSKNFKYVTPISNVDNYRELIENLNKNKGVTDIDFRKRMAALTFKISSEYDGLISGWLKFKTNKEDISNLRYGENPHQNSFIKNNNSPIFNFQISGKKISYNNIVDVESGLKCLKEFTKPSCVIIKHNNPCGVASGNNINLAFNKAYSSDMKSAFGGIVLLNKKVDEKFSKILSRSFFEVIVAKDYDKNALNKLIEKKNLILLKIDKLKIPKKESRSTMFGAIYQDVDNTKIDKKLLKLMAYKSVNKKRFEDLIFALKVVKHLKSNSIVLAKDEQTIGIGCGQTNRIDALEIAIKKFKKNSKVRNYVCASDGFFPFLDSLKLLYKNGCKIITQPYGSLNDKININYAKKNKISLYFMKRRLFRH